MSTRVQINVQGSEMDFDREESWLIGDDYPTRFRAAAAELRKIADDIDRMYPQSAPGSTESDQGAGHWVTRPPHDFCPVQDSGELRCSGCGIYRTELEVQMHLYTPECPG